MAIHWTVTFKTLRGGKTLTASVYDNLYYGEPIALKGGDEPFVTEENDDDDPFKAIRTQTGSLKIVDDGYALDGTTPFNWRDLQPRSDHDRPVILTDENDTILWQGFLQPQNFSGTLYEKTQEREFPLQCALSILGSQYPNTTDQGIVNFAYLLNYVVAMVSAASLTVVSFTEIIIQGGGDARRWLLKKFHWANLLSEDNEETLSPQYDLFTCLEDMCNFWGWQARTEGTRLYLMCQDDDDEQRTITFTPSQLASMAAGSWSGGTEDDDPFVRQDLTGNIFTSNDNDDMWVSGPSEVSVKADCNEQSTVVTFAPPTVEKQMDDAGSYTWVRGEEDNTGYYTTPLITSFDSSVLAGTAVSGNGGFCRRQYYSSTEQDNPTKLDMIVVNSWDHTQNTPTIQLQTKRMMSFSDGTLKIGGDVYLSEKQWEDDDNNDFIVANIGIGMTRETAKWYYLGCSPVGVITHGWGNAKTKVNLVVNGSIKGTGIYIYTGAFNLESIIEGIPVPATLSGYVFVDIIGGLYDSTKIMESFAIGNLKIEFSRESTFIPSTTSQSTRPRVVKKDRVSSIDYKSVNENAISNKQNIDLIYASDNNMKFGFGLVMNEDNSYMTIAEYRYQTQYARPEQHYADRIAAFWSVSKRLVTADLQTQAVEQSAPITPLSHLVLGVTHFRTLAISHQWRDDVTTLKMIQSLILIEDEEVEETVEEES